ncbi:hypothetical protein [Streptomyces sp. NPDC059009]|uniref:hypothetical protein n=1 Tax=Streptomyces sp. NPDC059009 TaxID=3346694 RepID=UPI0036BF114E
MTQRVRTLLEECVGGELGGFDALQATLDQEIARRQLAMLDEDEREGVYQNPVGSDRADASRQQFQANLADAEKRLDVAMERVERYKAVMRQHGE